MCSYSGWNSFLSNLSINYPVGAFVGSLSEKVYSVVGDGLEEDKLLFEESEIKRKGKEEMQYVK